MVPIPAERRPRRRRARLLVMPAALVGTLAAAAPARGQTLAARLERAGDGDVALHFAARAGVCGDGRGMIGDGRRVYRWRSWSITTHGAQGVDRWCVAGPVHVSLTRAGGRVTRLRTTVGVAESPRGTTDVGAVGAGEAAAYFLALASSAGGELARDALVPAALADSVVVWPDLVRFARDERRPGELRREAIFWAGFVGTAATAPALDSVARTRHDDRKVREAALAALAELPEGAGVPALLAAAGSDGEQWLRARAVFWLGQTGDDRARAALRAMVASPAVADELRGEAIFAIGHGRASEDDGAFLRRSYATLTSAVLRERTLQAVAHLPDGESWRWLLALAGDGREPMRWRKQALFWAGQGSAPTADLAALYERAGDAELREHAIFVLAQRDEPEAVDKLLDVARRDPDRRMRGKALFWLAQGDDPRVGALVREILSP